jgi:hypothetical protein
MTPEVDNPGERVTSDLVPGSQTSVIARMGSWELIVRPTR